MAMKQLFGEVGASTCVDVLKFDEKNKWSIVRVDSRSLIKLRSALTLYSSFLDSQKPCAFRVHQVSQHLMTLAANSRVESVEFSND
ncbi:hypothetical protein SNE40_014248 [Patella caerulea]|uniref:Uncharacterized protein n=1 Tax=Patella caerulea TaxID=87958 RepID=A0AAN8PQ80_PATCE